MGKPGTEVHLVFKLLIDVIVMVVGVSKETIEAATDVMQVLLWVLGNSYSVKVVRVHYGRCIVQIVDHVVDSATVGGTFVSSTDEDVFLIASHLGARIACARTEELHNEQIQL